MKKHRLSEQSKGLLRHKKKAVTSPNEPIERAALKWLRHGSANRYITLEATRQGFSAWASTGAWYERSGPVGNGPNIHTAIEQALALEKKL